MTVKYGTPTEEQLAKINRLAKRTFSNEEVFVFSGKAAGDMIIDNRYIQLSKELLETFKKDAIGGVSWLLNHSWSSFAEPTTIYGRTFDSQLNPSNENGETVALFIDKYIPRSDTLKNGRSANSIIEDIEQGILFDTSIGWGSNKMVCSICNMDYYGGECNHFRGRTYQDADGKDKLCFIIAKNPGYLMEESGVFDGAYKGAGISMSNAGDIFESPQGKFLVVDELKELAKDTNVYGIYTSKGELTTFVKKSDHKKVYSLGSKEGENKVNEKLSKLLETLGVAYKEGETTSEQLLNQLAEKWDATVQTIKDSAAPLAQAEPTPEYLSKAATTEKLGNEMPADDVLKFAKEGIEYHKQVVEDAVAMGVKAQGNEFPAETWKTTFATMGTAAIKDISKTFQKQAEGAIVTGRTSNPKAGEGEVKTFAIPDEAFKVGR